MKCFVPAEEELVMQLWQQDPASVIPFSRPLFSDLVEEATPSQPPPSQGEEQKRISFLPLQGEEQKRISSPPSQGEV